MSAVERLRAHQALIVVMLSRLHRETSGAVSSSPARRRFAEIYRYAAIPLLAVSCAMTSRMTGWIPAACLFGATVGAVRIMFHSYDRSIEITAPELAMLEAFCVVAALHHTAVIENDDSTRRIARALVESHPLDRPVTEGHVRSVLLAMTMTTRHDALVLGCYLDMLLRAEIARRAVGSPIGRGTRR